MSILNKIIGILRDIVRVYESDETSYEIKRYQNGALFDSLYIKNLEKKQFGLLNYIIKKTKTKEIQRFNERDNILYFQKHSLQLVLHLEFVVSQVSPRTLSYLFFYSTSNI